MLVQKDLAREQHGLVLVTGLAGSGKTATIAAMVDHVNEHREGHIVTIEDPVEVLHADKRSIIIALDGAGKPAWRRETQSAVGAPAARGGLIAVPFAHQNLALLDANGAIKARYFAAADPLTFYGLPTSPVVDNGNDAATISSSPSAVRRAQRGGSPLPCPVSVPVARPPDG